MIRRCVQRRALRLLDMLISELRATQRRFLYPVFRQPRAISKANCRERSELPTNFSEWPLDNGQPVIADRKRDRTSTIKPARQERYGYAPTFREMQRIDRAGNCARCFLPKSHSSENTRIDFPKHSRELVLSWCALSTFHRCTSQPF